MSAVMERPTAEVETPNGVTEARRHEMCEMNEHGDEKVVWDPGNEAEVKSARCKFADWKSLGYAMFAIDETDPDKPVLVQEFDPKYALLIAKPQIVGG